MVNNFFLFQSIEKQKLTKKKYSTKQFMPFDISLHFQCNQSIQLLFHLVKCCLLKMANTSTIFQLNYEDTRYLHTFTTSSSSFQFNRFDFDIESICTHIHITNRPKTISGILIQTSMSKKTYIIAKKNRVIARILCVNSILSL